MNTQKSKLPLFLLVVLVIVTIWSLTAWMKMRLPAGYHFWTDDKFWHTAILSEENIVIPPTVVDHAVQGDYILALSVNRDTHFSKEFCDSCRSLSSPCARYWAINWRTDEHFGAMTKNEYQEFSESRKLVLKSFGYRMPLTASEFCTNKIIKKL